MLWWALKKVGIPEWIVRAFQIMYQNARSRVRINNSYSYEFNVQVGVHQGSVLSPLLFIIFLEALSYEKTKIMICGENLHSLKDSGKHPCGVCCKGVGSNSIFCDGCQSWINKKCSGFKGRLKANPIYRCKRCMGFCRPVDGRPKKHVTLKDI